MLLIVVLISNIQWRRMFRNLLLISWLALFTLGTHLWAATGTAPSFRMGLQDGGLAAARLCLVVGWGTLLGVSTSALTLVSALERLLRPLARIGLPIQSFSLVAMLSMRFLPILIDEQQMLARTFIARGIDITNEKLRNRIKFYVVLCIPLLSQLFRRVEHLSAAMESRAFQAHSSRTILWDAQPRAKDYGLITGSAILLIGIVFF